MPNDAIAKLLARARVQAWRDRKRAEGMIAREVWVYAEDWPIIQNIIEGRTFATRIAREGSNREDKT